MGWAGGAWGRRYGRGARGYRPLRAWSKEMWFSSRMVPVARCSAARAFTYELLAATSVEFACASRLSYWITKKAGGGAHFELGLLGFERFLLQAARLHGGLVGGARAAHGDQRVFHFQARLVLQLAQADFRLLHLQLVARQVGFGDAVVDRQRHLHADAVGRIIAREDLAQRAAVAADEAGVGIGDEAGWPGPPGRCSA